MILVLLGADAYRRRERRLAAIAEFGVPPSDVVQLDTAATIQLLDDALMSLGLFATKRAVVIPDVSALSKPVAQRLIALLSHVSSDTLLIIEADALDKRTELAKALLKNPPRSPLVKGEETPLSERGAGGDFVTELFNPLQGAALERWVGERSRALGVAIEPAARTKLIESVGANSWRLHSELEKLATAALSVAPPQITAAMVKEHTLSTTNPSIFALTDAVVAGKLGQARLALAKLISGGEAPIAILGMLAHHVRTLVLVKDAEERGMPAKLHPFVVGKYRALAHTVPWNTINHWYTTLAAYDLKVKTGTIEPDIAVELMVHELSRKQ